MISSLVTTKKSAMLFFTCPVHSLTRQVCYVQSTEIRFVRETTETRLDYFTAVLRLTTTKQEHFTTTQACRSP